MSSNQAIIQWVENGQTRAAQWRTESNAVREADLLRGVSPAPTFSSIVVVDDQTTADAAFV
jgi:hypothetical protein